MRKIISWLCLLSLVATLMPYTYAFSKTTENTYTKAAVLQALGLDDASARGTATNEYLLKSLSGFLYGEDYKPSAEDFARMIGVLDFGEVYKGNGEVTKGKAFEYAISTLGYREYAKTKGANGAWAIASSLGITKGLGISEDELITVDECRVMLYNMLEVEPVSVAYNANKVEYVVESGHTLLSKYRDIYRVYGTLTADEITALNSEDGCADDCIRIGDYLYFMKDYKPSDRLLGKDVEAYVSVEDDSDEPTVLYLGERENKNQELVINARDIEEISSDYSELKYEKNNRIVKAKISNIPRVIYNGVFYGDYTVSDFKPENGNIRLLDNDGDSKYDVIFITSYETVIVSGVDTKEKIIYNKFTSYGNLTSFSLNPDGVKYIISNGEEEVGFSEIKVSDVLSVAKSKSTKNEFVEVLLSRETVLAKLNRINTDKLELGLDGETYYITNAFLRFEDEDDVDLEIGDSYTFYLDALGNVAYWKQSSDDGYVVMRKAYEDKENFDYYISYMTLDGVWQDAKVAKRMVIDGTVYKYPETAYEVLREIKGQVIKLTFNDGGEAKVIETAVESTTYDKNKLTKTPYGQYTWRSGIRAFSDLISSKCKYYLEDDASLVMIPDKYSDKSAYILTDPMGFFEGDCNYTVSLYDIDKYGFSKLVVMKYEPRISDMLFTVSDIALMRADGEMHTMLTGYAGEYKDFTLLGYDTTVFDGVEIGDIIKVSTNAEGYVDSYTKVFDLSDFTYKTDAQYKTRSYIAGEVVAVDTATKRLLIDAGGEKYSYRLNDTATVQEYQSGGHIETLDIYNIMPHDKIFIGAEWGRVEQIIILR